MDLCSLLIYPCEAAAHVLAASNITLTGRCLTIDCPKDAWLQLQCLIDVLAPCRFGVERVIFCCDGEYQFALSVAVWA